MTTKQWVLAGLVLLLGGISLYLNRDWFGREEIHIIHRSSPRPLPPGRSQPAPSPSSPVLFGFNQKLRLVELKVFPLHEAETNKYAHAIWHLVSDSNSVPVKSFTYGSRVPGMRPAAKGTQAEPLQPWTDYRLRIETADKVRVEHDFQAVPARP